MGDVGMLYTFKNYLFCVFILISWTKCLFIVEKFNKLG